MNLSSSKNSNDSSKSDDSSAEKEDSFSAEEQPIQEDEVFRLLNKQSSTIQAPKPYERQLLRSTLEEERKKIIQSKRKDQEKLMSEMKTKLDEEIKKFEEAKKQMTTIKHTRKEKKKGSSNLAQFRQRLMPSSSRRKASFQRQITQPSLSLAKIIKQDRTINTVPRPLEVRLQSSLLFDWEGIPNPECLRVHFLKEGRLEFDAALSLLEKSSQVFAKEPNLLELQAPMTVIGDIHGQFFDLNNIMRLSGEVGPTNYLFLGDYVDRGCFSTEVCFYLFALKLKNPRNIYLLRGNHETREMTSYFNFMLECKRKYNVQIYERFMQCFDTLPVAAVVSTESAGRFFCVHGGLSPDLNTLDDIKQINRFGEPATDSLFGDMLWSDPLVVEKGTSLENVCRFSFVTFDYNPRGAGYTYGLKGVRNFLKENDLKCVVRGHEVQKSGFKKHLFGFEYFGFRTPPGDDEVPVITVFSAPNYCGKYFNKGAFLKLDDDKYTLHSVEGVKDVPYCFNDFSDAINFTFPFVAANLMKIIGYVIGYMLFILCGEEEDEIDLSISKKVMALLRLAVSLQHTRNNAINSARPDNFKAAREQDFENERIPISIKSDNAGSYTVTLHDYRTTI
eukprot:TRINITY_DN5179_c0_g2_i1.p1 TRINITY_DN5179_c0_g2~~TRINITY_DN5179_c0_g2_i1.p1  ORF type:complete len:636 (-),score=115.62 TRINITY_DN5179_c0_g2_i1:130-1980(-)